jgi:hypothetical protein
MAILRWANPFLRNFNSERLKVNDKRGNPMEIAAAVVWRVCDTARAMLDIDNYEDHVPIQAESALRHLASECAYDFTDDDQQELTLRGGGQLARSRRCAQDAGKHGVRRHEKTPPCEDPCSHGSVRRSLRGTAEHQRVFQSRRRCGRQHRRYDG